MKKLLCVLMFGMVFGQAELTTRVYELSNLQTNDLIDLSDLTGVENYWYQVRLLDFTGVDDDWDIADIRCLDEDSNTVNSYAPTMFVWSGQKLSNGIETVCYTQFMKVGGHNGDFTISITAPFPEEDTGYIEEGFDYCIDVGANLIASPCRDEIDIIDTLPSEIADNLTGIIGQGVAANNQNGTWMGSLNGLGGGNGYWLKSKVNPCPKK